MPKPKSPIRLATDQQPQLTGRSVLVVENHPAIKFSLASAFRDAGAQVRFAADADEGAFCCNAAMESSRPFDLVVVGLGPRTCRRLRDRGYRGPIVAITDQSNDDEELAQAGADALLALPIEPATAVETAIALTEHGAQRPAAESDEPAPVLSDLAAFPRMQPMLAKFVEQLPQRLGDMVDAAAQRDLDHLGKLVSELKRSAGSHGFVDISREAAETERHLQVTDDLQHALDQLLDLCRRAATNSDGDPPLPPSA